MALANVVYPLIESQQRKKDDDGNSFVKADCSELKCNLIGAASKALIEVFFDWFSQVCELNRRWGTGERSTTFAQFRLLGAELILLNYFFFCRFGRNFVIDGRRILLNLLGISRIPNYQISGNLHCRARILMGWWNGRIFSDTLASLQKSIEVGVGFCPDSPKIPALVSSARVWQYFNVFRTCLRFSTVTHNCLNAA